MSIPRTKALIYCRVSSERQKNEGHGLDSQEHRCREYAKSKEYVVEEVFRDSFSGGGDFMLRPAMQALLEYADNHPHTNYIVVFDDLSRFARDVVFHLKLRQALTVRGIKPECLNFNFDDSPEGEMVEIMMAAQNQYHRKSNRRQVIQKQKARLEAGYWPFYPPPGYVQKKHPLHGKLLVGIEPRASIIREALEGFASGRFQEQMDVQKFLNKKGFYENKKKIYLDQVKRLLMRILYAGYVEYPDWEVARRKGHHEGFISLETYLKIQQRLNGKVTSFTRKDLNEDFPLRGLVNCRMCAQPLTASWSTSRGKRFPYYRCKTRGCTEGGKSIKRDVIEVEAENILRQVKPFQEVLDYAKARLVIKWEDKMAEIETTQKTTAKDLAEVRQEIRDLTIIAAKAKNDRIRATYEVRLDELIDRELVLEAKLNNPTLKEINFETAIESVFEYLKNPYAKWHMGDLAEKRLIIKLVFSETLEFDRKRGFGNTQLALPLKVFEMFTRSTNDRCGDGRN